MSRRLERPTKVLLTGGTSGIGAALLRDLLAMGHHVVVLARTASQLAATPGLYPHDVDLSNAETLPTLTGRIAAQHPDITVLINNAAVQNAHPLLNAATTPDTLQCEVIVNLLAPALLARAFAPAMIANGAGAIVNISSGLAFFPKQNAGLYAASKAGLHSFTQSLRYQMEGTGVAVIEAVLPLVDTPMTAGRGKAKISADAAAAAILQGLSRSSPVIRVRAAGALPLIQSLVPWLGRRMMRGS